MDRRFAGLRSRLSRPIEVLIVDQQKPVVADLVSSSVIGRFHSLAGHGVHELVAEPMTRSTGQENFRVRRQRDSASKRSTVLPTPRGPKPAVAGREDGIVDPEAIVPPINDERSLREHHQRYNLACPVGTSIPRVPGVLRSHSSDDVLDLQAFCAFYVFHASGFFIASHNNIGLR